MHYFQLYKDGFNKEGYETTIPNSWRGVNTPYSEDREPNFGGRTDLLGAKFSTHDLDNDQSNKHCAKLAKAGWWYKEGIRDDWKFLGLLYKNLSIVLIFWMFIHKILPRTAMMST